MHGHPFHLRMGIIPPQVYHLPNKVFAAGAGCIGIQNTEDGTCTPLPPWCRRSGPRKTIYLDPLKVHSCSLLAFTMQCGLTMHERMQLTMSAQLSLMRLMDPYGLSLGNEPSTVLLGIRVPDDASMVSAGDSSCGHMWRALSRPQ